MSGNKMINKKSYITLKTKHKKNIKYHHLEYHILKQEPSHPLEGPVIAKGTNGKIDL